MSPVPGPFSLIDRVAVVTGASRGIGAATAGVFAEAGAHVVLVARDETALDQVAAAVIKSGGRASVVAADLREPGRAAEMIARATSDAGPVDVLAAFAGGSTGPPQPIEDIEDADWAEAVAANLTTTFATIRAVLPSMVERGRGSIITMASTAARGPIAAPLGYAAAKAGIASLTRQVALQAAPHGVRANCLAPSTIRTERLDRAPDEQLQAIADRHPLRRLGEPDDVAHAALFLATDSSAWITGTTLDVAGGLIM